jgi:DNA polymerase III delta prime subunit
MNTDFLFTEKYRPVSVSDCILPQSIKKTFTEFVEQKEIPNLILSGGQGSGKTSSIIAICQDIGADYYLINGSDEGRFIDTVRTQVKNFASTMSLTSEANHKVIIIDEMDNTTQDVQLALRGNIEQYQNNCRFVFTCNYINKIISPIHSRCSVIDFTVPTKEKPALALKFFERLKHILNTENIKYDEKVLIELINKYFFDWRRLLNEVQRYSISGKIDSGILSEISNSNIKELMTFLKNKEYSNVQKWIVSNMDKDSNSIMRQFYEESKRFLELPSIPEMVMILAKYMYQSSFCADQEINLLACFTEIMMSCEFIN